jgi:lipid A disaccharide synthetase
VKELIQRDFTPEALAREALGLLADPGRLAAMRADLLEVKGRLGGAGASVRAAAAVREELARVRPDIDRSGATM